MEHHFNIDIAKDYDIESAILLHYMCFWIRHNMANGANFEDGRTWTYNSNDAFAKLFPYMASSKIYRTLKNLIEDGLLVKGNYNKLKFDHTTWYAFSDKGREYMESHGYTFNEKTNLQNDMVDFSNMQNRNLQNEVTIPVIKPNNNKEGIDKSIPKKDDNDFIDAIYDMYPTKCPVRNAYLGKSSKDKARIKKLMKQYTQDEIKKVVAFEVKSKYGKSYMSNFSTFLNNFPDPSCIDDCFVLPDDKEEPKSNKATTSSWQF